MVKIIKKSALIRTVTLVMVFAFGWVFLTGMGGRSSSLPEPDVNFHATLTDDQGVRTKCTKVSWEGATFISAKRGSAMVTIPFEKVRKFVYIIEGENHNEMEFRVTLRQGEVVAVTVDASTRLFGQTSFGNYRIPLRNVREVIFDTVNSGEVLKK
ncbi:MAG: hypothetical protein KAT46_05415 [Deltaproteobacteria bacterium]|nr:hypothetical protein [Deltaproteobacteria bacterium]